MGSLLSLLAVLKAGKLLTSAGTMFLFMATYAAFWGWRYAVGIVALILVHELGHCAAALERRVPVSLPMFVPFMGAFVTLRGNRDVETEACIAFGGPFFGTLAAMGLQDWGMRTGNALLLAVAFAGFMMNLFNLLPVSPLDGGRICAVLGRRIWLLGAPLLIGYFVWHPSLAIFPVLLCVSPYVIQALRHDPKSCGSRIYYTVSAGTRIWYGAHYLGLAALLGLNAYVTHQELAKLVTPAS